MRPGSAVCVWSWPSARAGTRSGRTPLAEVCPPQAPVAQIRELEISLVLEWTFRV